MTNSVALDHFIYSTNISVSEVNLLNWMEISIIMQLTIFDFKDFCANQIFNIKRQIVVFIHDV